MQYISTRGKAQPVSFSEAILRGLAPDGGLYIPQYLPKLDLCNKKWLSWSYFERCAQVLGPFMPEFNKQSLLEKIELAYADNFYKGQVAPIQLVGGGQNQELFVIELFHGPTGAFKDVALCLLPHLMQMAQEQISNQPALKTKHLTLLTATSGDTGKAALEAFSNVEGFNVIVFYPTEGVSAVQKRQMMTQKGKNVHVYGIHGNFDDAQQGVKSILSDEELCRALKARGMAFSSANSINIGRLLPQIVYYVSAYYDLVNSGHIQLGSLVDVCVPTGNSGNILAAYYAKLLGLPIDKLICASNANNVLTDFYNTGVYNANRGLSPTSSPSMDILVSSNLERLLYAWGLTTQEIDGAMQHLKEEGTFDMRGQLGQALSDFYAGFASDDQVLEVIGHYYSQHAYIADPHTAVALKVWADYNVVAQPKRPCLVAATASAYKFANTVLEATGGETDYIEPSPDPVEIEKKRFNRLAQIAKGTSPSRLYEALVSPVLHTGCIEVDHMSKVVTQILLEGGAS